MDVSGLFFEVNLVERTAFADSVLYVLSLSFIIRI